VPEGADKAKIKVRVTMNLHGLVSVEGATLVEEQPAEEPAAAPAPAAASADGGDDAAAAADAAGGEAGAAASSDGGASEPGVGGRAALGDGQLLLQRFGRSAGAALGQDLLPAPTPGSQGGWHDKTRHDRNRNHACIP
jgi:hypothetical protein